METVTFMPTNGDAIRLDYVAYEFYRIRRYKFGSLMQDVNGGYEEMQALLNKLNEYFGTDYQIQNVTVMFHVEQDIERIQLAINSIMDCSSLDYGDARRIANELGAKRVELEKKLKNLRGGK